MPCLPNFKVSPAILQGFSPENFQKSETLEKGIYRKDSGPCQEGSQALGAQPLPIATDSHEPGPTLGDLSHTIPYVGSPVPSFSPGLLHVSKPFPGQSLKLVLKSKNKML